MKLFPTFLTFLLFTSILFAQPKGPNINWSPVFKIGPTPTHTLFGVNSSHFYTIGQNKQSSYDASLSGKRDLNIIKFNKSDFSIEQHVTIKPFTYKNGTTTPFDISLVDHMFNDGVLKKQHGLAIPFDAWLIDESVYLFYVAYINGAKQKVLLLSQLDKDGNVSEVQKIGQIDGIGKYDTEHFKIQLSPDSSKVLVYYEIETKKKDARAFGVKVFDIQFSELYSKEISLPYNSKYYTTVAYTVSNKGDAYIAGYAEPDRSKGEEKDRNKTNRKYKIHKISKESSSPEEYAISLSNKSVHDIGIKADVRPDELGIFGFYSIESGSGTAGSFYQGIEQSTLQLKHEDTFPFSVKFLSNLMTKAKAKKGKGFWNFIFRDVIVKENGDITAIAEKSMITLSVTDNGGSKSIHFHGYIIAMNINDQDRITWVSEIPKHQAADIEPGNYLSEQHIPSHLSYTLLVDGDRLHFIYNDHPKNQERKKKGKDIKKLVNFRRSVAIKATIDANGRVKESHLFSNKEIDLTFAPARTKRLQHSNGAVIFNYRGNEFCFGTITGKR